VHASVAPSSDTKRSLLLFLAVTFITSWGLWLIAMKTGGSAKHAPTIVPYLLGGFGPVFGAIAVRIRRARRGLPAPARAVRFLNAGLLWWVPLLLIMTSATVVAGVWLEHLTGGAALSLAPGRSAILTAGGAAPFFVGMLLGGPLSEEPGWRGTAYPRLRTSLGRLKAGLLLGVVWAVWHTPLFFIHGTEQAGMGLATWSGLLFMLSVIPMALLTGFAYERVGVAGSMAVHFAVNTTMVLLAVTTPGVQALTIAVQSVLALTLLAGWRDRHAESSTQPSPQLYWVGETQR
jgi:membrane protease YdiL (CAAX protease family)